ncbi:MAG: hypothetical protein KC657_26285 [Myxococcales bacterium]|nr:hypothetical protein [Myxococcales bacterium]
MLNRARFDAPFWGLLLVATVLVGATGFLGLAAAAQTESFASADVTL